MALSNSQYQAIMRIYYQQQIDNKHQQNKRIDEVYKKVPQIPEIEEEVRSRSVLCAKYLLEGNIEIQKSLKAEIADLREQKDLLLIAAGYTKDYMHMHYECPNCQDTGYAEGKKCYCFKKEKMKLLYAQSNIDQILQRENFAAFNYEYFDRDQVVPQLQMTNADYMKTVVSWCWNFVNSFDDKKGNLIFTGSTGVGKTFLSNCIAKELIDRYHSVIYLSAHDLFEVFSKNKLYYETEEDMKDMYQHILECDLLIIDDLGTELNNTFTSSQLFFCINERLLKSKSTIISTNLSLAMLRDNYSDRISSRIISHYTVIPLYGEDIRTKKR